MRTFLLTLAALCCAGSLSAQLPGTVPDSKVIYLAADVCGNEATNQYYVLQTGILSHNFNTHPPLITATCATGGTPRQVTAYAGNQAAVNVLNTKTGGCNGKVFIDLFASAGGVAKANTKVLVFTSPNPDLSVLSSNTFASLCGSQIMVVFGNYNGTSPFFSNNNPADPACGNYLWVDIAIGTIKETIQYMPRKLLPQDGAFVGIDPGSLVRYGVAANCACPALGCSSAPAIAFSGDLSICEGEQATITASAPGINTYTWSNGQTGSSITVSPEITTAYYVSVSNVNSPQCVNAAKATVEVFNFTPPQLLVQSGQGTPPCYGSETRLRWTNEPASTPAWQWITPSGSTLSATGSFVLNEQSSGTYHISITHPNGCIQKAPVEVSYPSVVPVRVCTNAPLCPGEPIRIEASAEAELFQWSGPGNFTATGPIHTLNNLVSGVYTVTVTDANACTRTGTTAITTGNCAGGVLSANVNTQAGTCGAANGVAVAVAVGGVPPFTYDWLHLAGTSNPASSGSLAAGTYTVTITDAEGATASATGTVASGTALMLTMNAQHTTCAQANGSITLLLSQGTAPYTFNWADLSTAPEPQNRTALQPGTYAVTVSDAAGCTATGAKVVDESAGANATAAVNQVTCFGAANGAVNVTVAGGATPYTYNWADLSSAPEPEDRSNLAPGTYSLTVTASNGCVTTVQATISQPTQLTLSAASNDAYCGQAVGAITLTPGGGGLPYSYNWADLTATPEPQNRSGLSGGTYTVTLTDANACTVVLSRTIQQFTAPQITASTTNPACFGVSTGAINVTVSGGTPAYTYNWADLSSSTEPEDRSNLAAGTYSLTVTDFMGCTKTAVYTITQPAASLQATASTSNATCGTANGGITLTVSGGTAPYTYDWADISGTSNPQNRTAILAGTYTVTVKDAQNCTFSLSATVAQTGGPIVNATVTNVLCRSFATGAIDVSVSGGTSPYTYNWQDLTSTPEPQDRTGLSAGTYTVTVTTATGCTASASWTVTQPAAFLGISSSFSNTGCGFSNGSISVTGEGGTAPYTYNWSHIAGTNDPANQTNLAANTYVVTVTDYNNCTTTRSFTLQSSTVLNLNVTKTNTTCGNNNGTITLAATGGTTGGAPVSYTYDWAHLSGTNDIQNLTNLWPATFTVTVTSSFGCTVAHATAISASTGTNATAVLTHPTCWRNNGAIDLTPSGSTGPYTYDWLHIAGTSNPEDIGSRLSGTYTVTITSAVGCTVVKTYTLNNIGTTPVVSISSTNPTGTSNNGSITLTPTGGGTPYTYDWQHIAGTNNVQNLSNLAANTYTVTVKDATNTCSTTQSRTLVSQTPPQFTDGGEVIDNDVLFYLQDSSGVSTVDYARLTAFIKVFPNPATTNFVIDIPQVLGLCDIQITDASSRLIFQTKGEGTMQIESENWPTGQYFIAIRPHAQPEIRAVVKSVDIGH